ncbi:MAG: Ldh family oxidoreductase [Dehalococcoidia bacterium]|nr:Ldh family oxidoreductase [Dehalococcoidia bacterium]
MPSPSKCQVNGILNKVQNDNTALPIASASRLVHPFFHTFVDPRDIREEERKIMLERFLVPEKDRVAVRPERMLAATTEIFEKCGLSPADAALSAEVLLISDLRGCESHGVSNMLRIYVQMYGDQEINSTPNVRVTRETDVTANLDGDSGLGLHVLPKAMEMAIEKADRHGMGAVTVHNSRHIGMLAYHSMMPLKHDMIGITTSAGNPLSMVPTHASEKLFATNPWAWAAPARNEAPFVFDVATTQVAGNKLRLAERTGAPMDPAWISDIDGTPIMEEIPLPAEYHILPFGGTREQGSHKGYGFAAMAEIMAPILSGMGAGFFMPPAPSTIMGHYVQAIKIDGFIDPEQFKDDMDKFLARLRNAKPAPGHDRVVYAGLPEAEEIEIREKHGIPYHREVVEWFESIKAELGLGFELV